MDLEIQEEQIEAYYTDLYKSVFSAAVEGIFKRYHSPSMQKVEQIEKVLADPNTGDEVIHAVCNLYKGDIREDHIRRQREQWFGLARKQDQELTVQILIEAMTTSKDQVLPTILPDFANLLRIYLTLPSTSCEAERSFSVLRRLKNNLCTTMSQDRLNSVAILAVYKERVDNVDRDALMDEFIIRNDMRLERFAMKEKL